MGKPAARIGDMHVCPFVDPGPKPHVGGPIVGPSVPTVLIGGQPAAVVPGDGLQHLQGLLLRQTHAPKGRPLSFGEVVVTRPAVDHSNVLLAATPAVPAEVSGVLLAAIGALGVLTAELFDPSHGLLL